MHGNIRLKSATYIRNACFLTHRSVKLTMMPTHCRVAITWRKVLSRLTAICISSSPLSTQQLWFLDFHFFILLRVFFFFFFFLQFFFELYHWLPRFFLPSQYIDCLGFSCTIQTCLCYLLRSRKLSIGRSWVHKVFYFLWRINNKSS